MQLLPIWFLSFVLSLVAPVHPNEQPRTLISSSQADFVASPPWPDAGGSSSPTLQAACVMFYVPKAGSNLHQKDNDTTIEIHLLDNSQGFTPAATTGDLG